MIQEGIAVDPLLVRAGWNLATLIQTKFEKADVAVGHKSKIKKQTRVTEIAAKIDHVTT
ncbi:hypothetical protein [Shewanella sp. MEBiC00475]|uniref:hypothetical protein n=1 Tax=Shewanella sp. MEBiC00475 TaxID=2575361 RepID=UPI0015867AD3|nr:hypothetical protein [Shewanella sp. MEBiC00475]